MYKNGHSRHKLVYEGLEFPPFLDHVHYYNYAYKTPLPRTVRMAVAATEQITGDLPSFRIAVPVPEDTVSGPIQ